MKAARKVDNFHDINRPRLNLKLVEINGAEIFVHLKGMHKVEWFEKMLLCLISDHKRICWWMFLILKAHTDQTFTCSKSTIKSLE